VLHLSQFRRTLQLHGGIAALDGECQLLARAGADDSLHVGEAVDRRAIDRRDYIADLKAGRRRRTARFDLVDARRRARLAEEREQAGKDHDGQDEIGDRAGSHDRCAATNLLVMEASLALLLGHVGKRIGRWCRRLAVVAKELDVTAERYRRNLPSRAVAVVETDKFRTEAKRERQHVHAGPARHHEVAEFMKEDDDRQYEQKGNQIADEPMAQRIETMDKKL